MQLDDLHLSATEYARGEVARGLKTCGMIVSGTTEYLHGSGEPTELYALAWEVMPREFAAHLEAQAGWPARTDSDRLTDAFRALDVAGIVAREDFACCQSCGSSEIGAEVGDGAPARGYVFYHGQDAERAAQGGNLWLAYGSFGAEAGAAEAGAAEAAAAAEAGAAEAGAAEAGAAEATGAAEAGAAQDGVEGGAAEGDAARVGREVVAALRAEGLEVDWSGEAGQRIHVRLRWAKRRYGRMAAFPASAEPGRAVVVRFVPERQRDCPPMSAEALAALELPWLPDGTRVRVEVGERTVTIRRERHLLISDDGRAVGRFEGLLLLSAESENAQNHDTTAEGADGEGAGDVSADGERADGESADGESADGEGAGEVSADGERVAGGGGGHESVGGEGAGDGEAGLMEVTYQCLPSGAQQVAGRPMSLPEILAVVRGLPTRTDSWLSAVHEAGIVQMRWRTAGCGWSRRSWRSLLRWASTRGWTRPSNCSRFWPPRTAMGSASWTA